LRCTKPPTVCALFERSSKHPFEIAVLDLGLPTIDGYAVLPELTSRRIPVVVVTGTDVAPDQLDAACVLRKPASLSKIVEAVRRCLEVARKTGG